MTPRESKAALALLADDAEDTIRWSLRRSSGSFESRRFQLLETGSALVAYYSEGSAALAVDFYDESRSASPASGRFAAAPVILDRTVKIRRGFAWASEPLSVDDDAAAAARLTELMRSEVNRPYRDTVIGNTRRDPASAGWKRIASASACGFCKALASKGAVYKEATADFGAHNSCGCTCAPVFKGGEMGPEADVMQYMASRKNRNLSPAQRERVREWVKEFETEPRPHIKTSSL